MNLSASVDAEMELRSEIKALRKELGLRRNGRLDPVLYTSPKVRIDLSCSCVRQTSRKKKKKKRKKRKKKKK